MARSRTTTETTTPEPAPARTNGEPPKEADKDERPPMETALESCRRSRQKAKRHSDHAVAAIMLRAEAALIELEAKREDQQDLFATMRTPAEGTAE